ncbi:hypothetical protein [Longimicrobium sp.]|uniref:hypothetical protein n=1 Tax=Longimicrobium sp. TaxID=2029185 RepID=UPI002D80DDF8|nr:hypothetical protein [Longimicrobium sp.]
MLLLGAACQEPPAGATLTLSTQRFQTKVTLRIKGHGYTPGQPVTITIQNVPDKNGSDVVRNPTPDSNGNFDLPEDFSLKHVPGGTELPDILVIARDVSGWSLVEKISAFPFVILV